MRGAWLLVAAVGAASAAVLLVPVRTRPASAPQPRTRHLLVVGGGAVGVVLVAGASGVHLALAAVLLVLALPATDELGLALAAVVVGLVWWRRRRAVSA